MEDGARKPHCKTKICVTHVPEIETCGSFTSFVFFNWGNLYGDPYYNLNHNMGAAVLWPFEGNLHVQVKRVQGISQSAIMGIWQGVPRLEQGGKLVPCGQSSSIAQGNDTQDCHNFAGHKGICQNMDNRQLSLCI